MTNQSIVIRQITTSGRHLAERQSRAAITIQRVFRGSICRTALKIHLAAVLIQSRVRGKQARFAVKLYRCVRKIQAVWRAFAPRQSYLTYIAARKIQAQWRGYNPRQDLINFRAARKIQKAWQCYVLRQGFINFIAARKIQSVWRGYIPRQGFINYTAARKIGFTYYTAARKIQATWRGFVPRQGYINFNAARRIQAMWRGYIPRQGFVNFIAARKIQATWRGYIPRQGFNTFVAARKIQATWRSYIPRQGFLNFLAARRIQNKWRCTKANRDVMMLRRKYIAASLIQSAWRGFVNYSDFVFTLSDIVAAQRIARGFIIRKKYCSIIQSKLDVLKDKSNKAVAIQRIYRGFQERQNYWYTLGCTMQIQSWWRGRRVYHMIQKQVDAIIVLQCFTRCCMARQEYMQRRFVLMLIQTAELERSKKLEILKMKDQQGREDNTVELKRSAAARVIQRFFLQMNREDTADQLVVATKRRKKWRKNLKKEKYSNDVEEALLEDVWIGLLAQSNLDEEPFTRHYTNFGPGSVGEGSLGSQRRRHKLLYKTAQSGNPSSVLKLRPEEIDDASECSQLTSSTMAFAPHPTSSTRMIRKVDAIDMDDDFRLEEAFIDAEICQAKERRHLAGITNTGKKIHKRSGSSKRPQFVFQKKQEHQ